MRWRWQEDKSPGTPWANMARDEAWLEELIRDPESLPVVFVYRWDRPSVSIGRLQDANAVEAAFPGLTAVRRPTGGLAVVHGDDVTISVIVRADQLPATKSHGVLSSYRQIVGSVVSAFESVGVPAVLGAGVSVAPRTADIDCFALAARCDVVALDTGRKLAGCAQRRKQGVVLQQMSIPRSNLPNEREFLEAFKGACARIMGLNGWLSVDTHTPV